MILAVRLKNAIKAVYPNAEFKISNININGTKRGCSGFVKNGDVIVYVCTERAAPYMGLLYRYARSMSDYKGMRNQFNQPNKDERTFESDYLKLVIAALKNESAYQAELAHN